MIVPERINYASIGFWGEYTHNGMLYIFTPDEDKMSTIVEVAREISEKSAVYSGITNCARGVIIRTLGYSGDELFNFIKSIAALIC